MESSFPSSDWSRYAEYYDTLCRLTPYMDMHHDVVSLVHRYGSAPILDAGCGTGNLIRVLTHDTRIGTGVIGIDASSEMLARAQDKDRGSAHFIRADLNKALPLEDGGFGTVACVNALYAVNDPTRALAEIWRMLRKNGALIIVTPRSGYENGLILKEHCGSAQPDEYWLDAHRSPEHEELLIREACDDDETIERMLWIAAFNRKIARAAHFHFFTVEALLEIVVEAGFKVMEHTTTYARQSHLIAAMKV